MDEKDDRAITSINPNSMEKDSLVSGIDISKLSEILQKNIDHITKLDDFLNKIEDVFSDPANLSLLSFKDSIRLYKSISQRMVSSERYVLRVLEIVSKDKSLERLLSMNPKVEAGDVKGPSLKEKEVARKLRELILKKVQNDEKDW